MTITDRQDLKNTKMSKKQTQKLRAGQTHFCLKNPFTGHYTHLIHYIPIYILYIYIYNIYIYIYIYSSSSSSSSSSGARSLENGKIRGPFLAFFLVSRHILCRQFIILCYNIMYQMYIYVSSLLNMTTNRTLGSQETTEHFGCMKTKIYRPIYQIYHILYI